MGSFVHVSVSWITTHRHRHRHQYRHSLYIDVNINLYQSWNNVALMIGGQNSPIYNGWQPCKLSMLFTPDCSPLSYTNEKKLLTWQNYQLDCVLHYHDMDSPVPLGIHIIHNIFYLHASLSIDKLVRWLISRSVDRFVGRAVRRLVQSNLALTDFRGPTSFIWYRRNSIVANMRNKIKPIEETKNWYSLQAEIH